MTAIIAGVGMIPFAKPGASAPYDEMGEVAIRLALDDAGNELTRKRVATQLCLRRQHKRAACDLPRGHDGHPDYQREQQLFERFNSAFPRTAGCRKRCGRMCAGGGF